MLKDIVRFEWRYHTRQLSFIAATLLFAVFGFALTATGFGPANIHIDSPYSIAQSVGMLSLLSVFVLAVFCANAVVRDRETRMEEIVFSTPIEKLPFLAGRFTGSFLAAFTAFSASVVGMLLARFMPWQDADRLGSLTLVPYLWALLVIALPNLLFAAVVLFSLSTITRSVLASYAGSVIIYVLYFVAAAATGSPLMASSAPGANEGASLASLLDPFALSAFFEQTRNWTPDLRNTKLLSLTGNFLLNRLTWIAASLAGFAAVYRLFSFRAGAEKKKKARIEAVEAAPLTTPYAPVPPAESQWRAFLSTTRIEIRSFLLGAPFAAMTLLWAALAASEIASDITSSEYGSASYPTAALLFATIRQPLAMVATILLVYLSAEIVWRERALRISSILHATPTSNFAFIASKCTALFAMVSVLTAVGLGTGAVIQLLNGWPPEPGLLLAFAYFFATPILLFAILAVVVQTLSPHKYVGMLLVLVLAVMSLAGDQLLGIGHPLWRFGSVPALSYSGMSGFSGASGFHWFMLFWSALALLLLFFAAAMWRHGAEGFRRLRPILSRTSGRARAIAFVLALVFVASGAFIFYNTNILNTHTTSASNLDWRAAYEKQYRAYAGLPQPRIRDVKATVDLFPSERRFRVRGEYVLVNETSAPIAKVLIAGRRNARTTTIAIPAARLLSHETRFNQHLFQLDAPLAPGGRVTVRFDTMYATSGFTSSEPDQSVIENGSYITSPRVFPMVGYRGGYEIADPRERRRRGLPVTTASSSNDSSQHEELESADWVALDLTVSTAADQVVVAPGRLVRAWNQDGRRSFHFHSDTSVPNQFAIASARYQVVRETHDGVAIEVYHHPSHGQNVARIMRATAESLRLFRQNFGPYSHPHLRLAEIPAHWNVGGFAQPGMIVLGEKRGFLIDARDPERLDLVYRRVAHEVAHQWWGYTLVPVYTPGSGTLVETLTKYSELLALEKVYGPEYVRRSLALELDLYLAGRTGDRGAEPPLSQAIEQGYVTYRKGSIVMYALRDLLGEAAVNGALRNLIREKGGPDRSPTTADLLRYLRAAAAPEHHVRIDEWMNQIVLYDLRLESASSHRRADGKYDVKLRIAAAKHRVDGAKETTLPFVEAIQIALYSREGKQIYLARHALRDGAQDITIVLDALPAVAAVDPSILRVDRNRFDNTKDVASNNAG